MSSCRHESSLTLSAVKIGFCFAAINVGNLCGAVANADGPATPLPACSGALAEGIQEMDIDDRRRKHSGLR